MTCGSASLQMLAQVAPEYASDPRASDALSMAAEVHNDGSRWGSSYVRAMALYAAHHLAVLDQVKARIEEQGGAVGGAAVPTGALRSRSAGDISESYASASLTELAGVGFRRTDAFLAQTAYGQQYLAIRDTRGFRVPRMVTV